MFWRNGIGQCLQNQTIASMKYSSLLHEVENRQEASVRLLLIAGAPVNLPGLEPHDTPLHLAVSSGYFRITKTLLKYNADVFICNQQNVCPLEIAIRMQNQKIVKLFLDHVRSFKCLTSVNFVKLIISVMWQKDVEDGLISWLTKPPPQVIIKDCPGIVKVLHGAVFNNYPKMIQVLLDNGVNINGVDESKTYYDQKTALAIACRDITTHPLVEYLLEKGAKVNVEGVIDTALHSACMSGNLYVVKLIVNSGADLYVENSEGLSPISLAIKRKQNWITAFLLKMGKYNISHGDLESAIFMAVNVGDVEFIEEIFGRLKKLSFQERLQYGINAEVLKKIFCGDTYYHSGRYTDKCIESMVKNGFDINLENASGITPLFSAMMIGYDGVVTKLLQYGADVNHKCNFGRTPFNYFQQAIKSRKRFRQISINHEPYKVRPKRDQKVVDIFTQHVIKMKMLGLEVDQVDYDNAIELGNEPLVKRQRYEKEVENLKKTVICDDVTFYDIASANLNKMIRFLDNDVIYKTLKTGKYKHKFRLFGSIISNSYHRGLYRKSLLDQACDLGILDHIFELPYDCVRKIIEYLTNIDLVILIYKHQWHENDKILNKKRTNDCTEYNKFFHCNKKMKV